MENLSNGSMLRNCLLYFYSNDWLWELPWIRKDLLLFSLTQRCPGQSWVLLYYLTLFRTRMFDFRKCGWTNHLTTLTGAGNSLFRSSLFTTMSDSLSSLFKMSDHELIAISLFCWKKFVFFTCFWQFFTVFPLFMPKSESLPSLFVPLLFFKVRQNSCCSLQKSDHEQIAPLAIYKRATVSNSIPSLFTKELREQFTLFQERIAILLFRSQKTSDSLEKPKSEFPTLISSNSNRSIFTEKIVIFSPKVPGKEREVMKNNPGILWSLIFFLLNNRQVVTLMI